MDDCCQIFFISRSTKILMESTSGGWECTWEPLSSLFTTFFHLSLMNFGLKYQLNSF